MKSRKFTRRTTITAALSLSVLSYGASLPTLAQDDPISKERKAEFLGLLGLQ